MNPARWRGRIVVAATLAALAPPLIATSAVSDDTVAIPDWGLRVCIENALGRAIPGEPLTRSDLESLTTLACHSTNLSTLEGLDAAANLAVLDLSGSTVTNIDAASSLTKLTSVDLSGTPITSLVALTGLPTLATLNISDSRVGTLASIPALTSLATLDASWLDLGDVTPLASSSLTEVNLDANAITDLSPLALRPNLAFSALNQHLTLADSSTTCDVLPTPTVTDLDGSTVAVVGGAPAFTPVPGGFYAIRNGVGTFSFSSPAHHYSGDVTAYSWGWVTCPWLVEPKVTVSGVGTPASPLVASVGAWSPTPSAADLAWYTADGHWVASGPTYGGTGVEPGTQVHAVVVPHLEGLQSTQVSSPWVTILGRFPATFPFAFENVPVAATDAFIATYDFPIGAAISCTWRIDGAIVASGTSCTYAIPSTAGGKSLSATITASAPNYVTATYAVGPTTVVSNFGVMTTTATIAGTRDVGRRLTVTPAGFPTMPSSNVYQWLRDGAPIPGATAPSYLLTAADGGHMLTIRITAARPGFLSVTYSTYATYIRRAFVAPRPTITGITRVGHVLYAQRGTWAPGPTTIRVQWYRDGKPILGATQYKHTVSRYDAGHRLTVKVTGWRSGYTTTGRLSGAVTARW